MYRQLGDSNSQWHKKKVQKSASWGKCKLGKCQLGDVPVGEVPVGGSASWGTLTSRISWAHFLGVPAVRGLKFSMAQKKVPKSASWGKCQLGEVPVGGSASWGKCQFGD